MQQNGSNVTPGTQVDVGMTPSLAGALSYVLGIITGVTFLMMSKDSFVRFHAYQSIFLSVAWIAFWIAFSIVSIMLGFIPFLRFLVAILGLLMSLVLGLGFLVLWIVLIVKASQGQRWKLPFIGNMAEKYAGQAQ